jgi:hypothetical protein
MPNVKIMSIFSSTSISCHNWSPNYSVLVDNPPSTRIYRMICGGQHLDILSNEYFIFQYRSFPSS